MKSHLRLFSFLLAGLIACVSLCVFPVFAASGRIQVYAPATPVAVGDSVTVTITLYCDTGIGSWSFSVNYDSSRLQYVSGADDGGGGRVSFSEAVTSSGVTSKSFYVRFRAIAEGSATVRSGSVDLVSWDFEEPGVSSDSCVITVRNPSDTQGGGDSSGTGGSQSGGGSGGTTQQIVTPPVRSDSSENRLSALSVTGYPISPEFDPEQSAYTLTVPYAQKSVEVNASVLDASARASVDGASDLAVGENTVTVTVTAANGDKRTYTITVTRADADYDALGVAVDDQPYQFPRDPAEISEIPEGFTASAALCENKRVLTFVNATGSIRLAVLLSDNPEDPEESVFLYDEHTQTFSPFVPAQTAPRTFVILPLPADRDLPEGYRPAALFLAETELNAWVKEGDAEHEKMLVWASPVNGEAAFYFYEPDTGEFELAFSEAPVEDDAEREKELGLLQAEVDRLKEKNETLWRTTRYTILAAIGLIVLLALSLIVTHLVKRARRVREEASLWDEEKEESLPDEQADAIPAFAPVAAAQDQPAEDERQEFPVEEQSDAEERFSFEEEPYQPTQDPAPVEEAPAPVEEIPAPVEEAPAPIKEASAPAPVEEAPAPTRPRGGEAFSAVSQIFGTQSAPAVDDDELFSRNNPTVDESEDEQDEDGDHPIYDFHHDEP